MNMNDGTNRVIAGTIVVLLIGGAWYLGKMQGGAAATTPGTAMVDDSNGLKVETGAKTTVQNDTPVTTPAISASGDKVVVLDQPAGMEVKVSSVTLPERGWVAVKGSNGWVLGAQRLEAGTTKDVVVALLRATVAGEKYQVFLYSDDGDGKFDLHKDSLVMNADAGVVGTSFSAQ